MIGLRPKRPVVLLGAGASNHAGCPLVHGVESEGLRLVRHGLLPGTVGADAERALEFAHSLRRRLHQTNEDLDNIESVMSFAESLELLGMYERGISASMRRFIDGVITHTVNVPSIDSSSWQNHDVEGGRNYTSLVRMLAEYGGEASVISLNYDCVFEYNVHCLGLPFTYGESHAGKSIEVLKLHGSSNWVDCEGGRKSCPPSGLTIPMKFQQGRTGPYWGHLIRQSETCATCDKALVPLIVPPTSFKRIDDGRLQYAWARAAKVLSEAEMLVSIGYSLPDSDVAVRHLLHAAFTAGNLRRAVVVLLNDEEADGRWRNLFRDTWSRRHLRVLQCGFTGALRSNILWSELEVDETEVKSWHKRLLPLRRSIWEMEDLRRVCGELNAKYQEVVRSTSGMQMMSEQLVNWQSKARSHAGAEQVELQIFGLLKKAGLEWNPSEAVPAIETPILRGRRRQRQHAPQQAGEQP